jgi:hypothetical protein
MSAESEECAGYFISIPITGNSPGSGGNTPHTPQRPWLNPLKSIKGLRGGLALRSLPGLRPTKFLRSGAEWRFAEVSEKVPVNSANRRRLKWN